MVVPVGIAGRRGMRTQPPPIDADLVRAWGDRRTGIGFDQLLLEGCRRLDESQQQSGAAGS